MTVQPNPVDVQAPADDLYCPGATFYADRTRVRSTTTGPTGGMTGTTFGVSDGERPAFQAVKWDGADDDFQAIWGHAVPTGLEVIARPEPLDPARQAELDRLVDEWATAYLLGTDAPDDFRGVPLTDDHNIAYRLREHATPPDLTMYPRIRAEVDRRADERNFRTTAGIPVIMVGYQACVGLTYPYPQAQVNVGDLIMGDVTASHMDRARVAGIAEETRYGRHDVWVELLRRSYSPVTDRWTVEQDWTTGDQLRCYWIKIA